MEIDDIIKLQEVQPGELPATLKKLIIINCERLESLPEGIDNNNTCHLEYLHVWGCPSLKSIPRGYFPSTLETLSIWDCQQLESIPGNMQQNLTSLQVLLICNCRDVLSSPEAFLNPNLEELCISDCENMRWHLSGWGLHTLTSLDKLMIQGPFPDLLSFPSSHLLLPTSITCLRLVNLYNLKSIASISLQSLISLKSLELYNCPKLWSFVPKGGQHLQYLKSGKFPAIHICKVLRPYQIWATTSLPTKGWAKGLMFGGSFCLKLSILIQSPLIVKRNAPLFNTLVFWDSAICLQICIAKTGEVNLGDEPACLRKPGFGLENLGGLWMDGCDGVVSLDEQRLPCNLQYLEVKGCFNLEKLPNALCTLTSLIDLLLETLADGMVSTRCAFECLEIVDCPSLIRLPKGKLSTTLKKLLIIDCQKLESLPEGIMHHTSIDSNNTCRLEQLHVLGCLSLKCIPRGNFPSFLEMLFIWNCKKLEPIPCNILQNLTALDCENMKKPLSFVPKEGLPPSLARLVIMGVLF
ncbi:putative disease resistance protein [Vitis vinifera]|uniref:Putative disease resistance protein n=1 Tax=Vitis vinifera TaxID=29760 RepID=A0A438I7Y6_VITVI|nr:putative disease resistance protein [Vitis vinifera]